MKALIICFTIFVFSSISFPVSVNGFIQSDSTITNFSDSTFNDKLSFVKEYLHRGWEISFWQLNSTIKELQNGIMYLGEVTGIKADTSYYFISDNKYRGLQHFVWKWEDWYEQRKKNTTNK
jgi:hypothetical protein